MNPVQARPVDELQRVHRNVFCENYDCCLDFTLLKGWRNFSCASCACCSLMQKTPADWEEDMLRCGALVGVVFGLLIMPETGF
jgi:hypothetical protein